MPYLGENQLQKCMFWLTAYENAKKLCSAVNINFQQTVTCNSETSLQ